MDATEQQHRRMTAAALFEEGTLRDSQIAALLGVTTRAVNNWHHAWSQEGAAALASKGPTGPHCLLTQDQQHELRQVLRRGAKDYGFATDGWTLARIRRVIAETFGVVYADLSGVWRLLHRMGWTNQLPTRRAIERDEEAIADWVEHTWPDIEKRGPKVGRGSASRTRPGAG
ncbi:winged helix-turn-helix domain-containing protein [Nocardiopsis synnemataformans]|uniref:winged helix-turn-helix domain-containing protein n=1 Tax=Nocardiopsis synnemataformans TaxID=61305 RepID=UPI003EBBFA51